MGTLSDYLKQQGAPDTVLREARELEESGLRQADYSRNMQELARQREQLSFLAGQLQTQQQGNGSPHQTAVDRYLDGLGDDDSANVLRSALGPALRAVMEDVQGTAGQDLANVKRALKIMHQQRQVEDVLENDLVTKYGPEVRKKFGDLKQQAMQQLLNDREVNVEQLLWNTDREFARGLLAKQETASRQRRASETTEGFERPHREGPPMDGGLVVTGGAESPNASELPKDRSGIVDWEAYFKELRAEVPLASE